MQKYLGHRWGKVDVQMLIKVLIKKKKKFKKKQYNNKLHLHFILFLLNLTKVVLKNRHKFEYPHLIYLTMYSFTQRCLAFSNGVTLPSGAPIIFLAPHNNLMSKNIKKGRHFFWRALIAFLAPPGAFRTPNIFSRRPNAKLAEIWYMFLPYQTIFR